MSCTYWYLCWNFHTSHCVFLWLESAAISCLYMLTGRMSIEQICRSFFSFSGCYLFVFPYDLIGPDLWMLECFDYSHSGRKSGVWIPFDTGSASRDRMSFISILLLFWLRKKWEKGHIGEELTGLQQTQRMAAAGHPCCLHSAEKSC